MKKLLALNRGEIAIRVFRAANELGLGTVAIYSKEDRLSLHRFKADEAYQIGEGMGPVQAYLDVDGIVALAKAKDVDYIHPGYGFLSENPALARACAAAGITFVGPDERILTLLGDKTAARQIAMAAGVPVLPGSEKPAATLADAQALAPRIGFPLILKAAFGGGGRGMRVVDRPADLGARLHEATAEAQAAFGNGAVFLERYIRRAKHVEVQILGDKHGAMVHLWERDCSVQRRHQKVVEIAPAFGIDPSIRTAVCEAAVALCRRVEYYGAGTVEFLVDLDSREWFFIEVNPRVQVEHTVTEEVTGIDIVRAQIQAAQGHALHGPEMGIPAQDRIEVSGTALQCRVTTEDPASNFLPDYGKIQTYRSPAGFGVRLDGASAYGGAVITPYYDSLLVKVTTWGVDFIQACQRMDRALREFRIRGVKTNIPFLENVVNDNEFQRGAATTTFLEHTPSLFQFSVRQDRATRLLTYLGDVMVNGNPEMVNRTPPPIRVVSAPPHDAAPPPAGTRDALKRDGPETFAAWTRAQKRLLVTDTTMRDAHQSVMATRMRTFDMVQIANWYAQKLHNLYSIEMWGGATFDVALRFLHEDPWLRLRKLRDAIPNICFQMLLRASNAVGYTAYPDNVVRRFVAVAAEEGIDIFRVFDSLNGLANMKPALDAVRRTDAIAEGAICYTGDILDPARDKYPLAYYVKMAQELERMGAHILGIKDMAGLLKPYAAYKLVKTLKEAVALPIHFHTHDTSGINAASILKASEAGVDVVDAALSSMSGTTSQPNLNSLAAALQHDRTRGAGLDLDALNRCSDYWEDVRANYAPFDSAPRSGAADVYLHEMPGGQYTNLREQAESLGLGRRWPAIARMYADVNRAFGDIVKVTPSSKVVGDMALFLIQQGMTVHEFERLGPNHSLNIPNSVVEMFEGALGQPQGGWPPAIAKVILKGRRASKGRPGKNATPVDLDDTRRLIETKTGRAPSETDLMSYLMYPSVYLAFDKARAAYGDLTTLPTPAFFYGLTPGDEITVEIEAGKALVLKFLAVGDPHQDGTRTVFFEVNGQPREVTVRDQKLKAEARSHPTVDPTKPGQVGAPIPGAVTSIVVELNQEVKKGDKLLVMEAMKMQTTVYAPIAGRVTARHVNTGQTVQPKDLLVTIE